MATIYSRPIYEIGASMTTPFVPTKHDQRIKTLQDALTAIQALPASTINTQLLLVIQALLEEVIIIHDTLVNIPAPPWAKKFD